MANLGDVWEGLSLIPGRAELVFTAGCLIHIPPEDILGTMDQLIEKSYQYVMCIEYELDDLSKSTASPFHHWPEIDVVYRGETDLLWKRPYIEMYQEKGLTLLDSGRLQMDVGFDNCHYGLLTK